MFRIMTPDQAVQKIPDGAWIGLNPFLTLSVPNQLHDAIRRRFECTGHPSNLRIFSPCGFGLWDRTKAVDQYAALGAVDTVVTSHFNSMPVIQELASEGKIEAYCLPLGVMSHLLRSAAGGQKNHISKVGLNIFVDPKIDGAGVNERSTAEWVQRVKVADESYLLYKTPKIDVVLIKGTSVDPQGNISFSDECVMGDALSFAQTAKNQGGMVIVQVDRVSHTFERPRNVVIPGILVDIVCVCENGGEDESLKALDGSIHVPSTQMDYWMEHIQNSSSGNKAQDAGVAHHIIGRRAAEELKRGDVVNIGIGTPEMVGKAASESGILRDIVLTVESGGIGGLPAPGNFFGATIGADCIVGMAEQFDFYDGGGLDICFMGALEVDKHGNVNVHRLPNKPVGIGGFGNITGTAKVVVFCLTFNAKGLEVEQDESGSVHIFKEGCIPKFVDSIGAISFSAKNALKNGQRVLYVTERCVFTLTDKGLKLIEVYDGINTQTDILDNLNIPLAD